MLQVEENRRPSARELIAIVHNEYMSPGRTTPRKRVYNLEGLNLDNANEVADFVLRSASNEEEKAELWLEISEKAVKNLA